MGPDRSPTEARAPLTRERVIRAAVELADAEGIEALSMRRLGRKLGVEAMSLYHHVRNKDELLDGLAEAVAAEMEPAAVDGDWKAAVRRSAISAHRALRRHRWAPAVVGSRTGPNAAQMRYMNALLGCLRRGGLSPEMTHHAYHALDSHVTGFALWLANMDLDPETLPALGAAFLQQLPRDAYPWIAEHVEQHISGDQEYDKSEFEFGLDLILDGLDRLRTGPAGPA